LQHALTSRIRIEQAKGIVAHTLTVSIDEAFQVLRYSSRCTNTKLGILVDHLLQGRITATELIAPPRVAA